MKRSGRGVKRNRKEEMIERRAIEANSRKEEGRDEDSDTLFNVIRKLGLSSTRFKIYILNLIANI